MEKIKDELTEDNLISIYEKIDLEFIYNLFY